MGFDKLFKVTQLGRHRLKTKTLALVSGIHGLLGQPTPDLMFYFYLELLHFFIHKIGINDMLYRVPYEKVYRKRPVYCLEYSASLALLLSKVFAG